MIVHRTITRKITHLVRGDRRMHQAVGRAIEQCQREPSDVKIVDDSIAVYILKTLLYVWGGRAIRRRDPYRRFESCLAGTIVAF